MKKRELILIAILTVLLAIVSKVVWTVGMGIFFGMVYKKTRNLWVPVVFHFLVKFVPCRTSFQILKGMRM